MRLPDSGICRLKQQQPVLGVRGVRWEKMGDYLHRGFFLSIVPNEKG